jgi:hypothetical protein
VSRIGSLTGLSAAEAKRVASVAFGGSLRAPDASELVRRAGGVKRFVSDNSAVVNGSHRLLVSSSPLRLKTPTGDALMDTRLRLRGKAFRPVRSPRSVAIGRRLDDGLNVGGVPRITVQAQGERAATVGRRLSGSRVLYANAAPDTDVVLANRAEGVEILSVVRSVKSPERLRIAVDVPRGGGVIADGTGGLRIRDARGRDLGLMSAAVARDAAGASVPASLQPDGRRHAILETRHRGRSVTYPILVDPLVRPYLDPYGNGAWFGGDRTGIEEWATTQSDSSGTYWATRSTCYQPVSCNAVNGLYIYGMLGSTYASGSSAMWTYDLSTTRTAYIHSAQFLNAYYSKRGDTSSAPFMAVGILNRAAGAWTGVQTYSADVAGTLGVTGTTGAVANGKTAVFGMFNGAARTLPTWQDAYVGGVILELEDPEAPTLQTPSGNAGPGAGWVRGQRVIRATASDPGLGVHQFAVGLPGLNPAGGSLGYPNGCTGRTGQECPTTITQDLAVDTTKVPNGTNQAGLWAYDAGGRVSSGSGWQLKVDNELPTLTATGSIAGLRNHGNLMEYETNALRIDATDGSGSVTRAGVAKVTIDIAGQQSVETQPCATTQDSCALSRTVYLTTAGMKSGVHHIHVDVEDRAGNHAIDDWDVYLYRTSWNLGGTNHKIDTPQESAAAHQALAAAVGDDAKREVLNGLSPVDRQYFNRQDDTTPPTISEIDRPGFYINDRTRGISFGASDVGSDAQNPTDGQTGISDLRIVAAGFSNWGPAVSHMLDPGCLTLASRCPDAAHVVSAIGGMPEGVNTVEVRATDGAGNAAVKQYHVLIDTIAPVVAEIARPGAWTKDRSAYLSFRATDYGAGSGIRSFRIFAPGSPSWDGATTSAMVQPCTPSGGCVNGADIGTTVGNLPSGLNIVQIEAIDAAGNVTNAQYHVPVDAAPPTVEITGGLADTGTAHSTTDTTLNVRANDAQSGARSIQLYEVNADGSLRGLTGVDRSDSECPGYGCNPTSMGLDVPGAGGFAWQPGIHRVRADVWDRAGNLARREWSVPFNAGGYAWASDQYGGSNHQIDTDAERAVFGDALFLAGDEDFNALVAATLPADWQALIAWRGTRSDWDIGSDLDDSDIVDSESSTLRAHWGWWHIVRKWSDAKALQKQRQMEDAADSITYVGTILGFTGDLPGAVAALVARIRFHDLAVRTARAREDANGRGIRVDLGFRCTSIPLVPDPCWPALWIKPR